MITPEARGPDQYYEGLGAADVFEVWADVARALSRSTRPTPTSRATRWAGSARSSSAPSSPTCSRAPSPPSAFETNNDVLASLRNLPVLMWNTSADELVNAGRLRPDRGEARRASATATSSTSTSPAPTPLCSPLFPNHLELAINDQFAPAAAFLGTAHVDCNPAHVTYVVDTRPRRADLRDRRRPRLLGLGSDAAEHVAHRRQRRSRGPVRRCLARLRHFGDPAASGMAVPGAGTLTGGNMGPLTYASLTQTWGPTPTGAGERLARHQRDQHRHRDDRPLAGPRRLQRAS